MKDHSRGKADFRNLFEAVIGGKAIDDAIQDIQVYQDGDGTGGVRQW